MKCETKMLGTKSFFLSNKIENCFYVKHFFARLKNTIRGSFEGIQKKISPQK